MIFSKLSEKSQITHVKNEYANLVKKIFYEPEVLSVYAEEYKIPVAQCKVILKIINSFNSKPCVCCRQFDSKKMFSGPIDQNLEPILTMAQTIVKQKEY
jgi:hypothetical protein